MQTTENQTYNIQFVANITGINPHTIRAWEKRYQAILPQRDHNGRRLYSNSDIDRLSTLHKLVKMGNSISDIASLSSQQLIEIGEQYSDVFEIKDESNKNYDFEGSLKNIMMGLDFFKLDVINHELQKAAHDLSSVDFALKIASPIIEKIRVMKKNETLDKDKRLQVYLLLKSQMIKKIFHTKANAGQTKKVVVAAAEGELNELGSMLATILFLDVGLDVDFLGANVNENHLGTICSQIKPDILFVGINYSHESDKQNLDKGYYLETLGQYMTPQTKVMVGAYDVCFNIPNFEHECVLDFEDLHRSLNK